MEIFQTLHDCNLACGQVFHIRFDDLEFILRSQECQNHKLQIFLIIIIIIIFFYRFLSTVI